MTRRAHIPDKTKLASALLALGLIDYEHAKAMGRDNFLSLFQFDHGILHGVEVNNEFWNLTPRLILEHREKSGKDTGIVAKVKRISRANDASMTRLLAKLTGKDTPPTRRSRIPARISAWPPKGSRKMQSRSFR
jgi:hypothetical protein